MYRAKGSKLGVVINDSDMSWLQQLIARGARLPLVKAVDRVDLLAQARGLSWATTALGQISRRCWEWPNLFQAERRLMKAILDKIATSSELRGGLAVDYWELYAVDPSGPDEVRHLAALMDRCMERAGEHELRLALFGLDIGNLKWSEMKALVETGVFGRARARGHILALRERVPSGTPIDRGWNKKIPGAPPVPGAGRMCFRYRYLYHLLEQRDEVLPLVISELHTGGTSPEDTLNRAIWYDNIAQQDYYLLAFLPVNLAPSPTLVDYLISTRDRENARWSPIERLPPPRWIIFVQNRHAIVSQGVAHSDGSWSFHPVSNWRSLEEKAIASVVEAGGSINQSGIYPCPDHLSLLVRQ